MASQLSQINPFTTSKASYFSQDFVMWEKEGRLILTPSFQRRPVWKPAAKSFFIDSLLRGMTVPTIYLRLKQIKNSNDTITEVVDGQQRIRAVLDFINDSYQLSKMVHPDWVNKRFSQLTLDQQRRIKSFSFSTETFGGISDQQVLEVFCRLNTNGIQLNNQELRNGRYFGHFKQLSYSLAYDYLEFWRSQGIFSETLIARMMEVELTSELLVCGNDGMQDKKSSIDKFYTEFEEAYPSKEQDKKRFNETMRAISEAFENDLLSETEFSRPPLFYTLYSVVYHHLFGLPKVVRQTPKKRLSKADMASLKTATQSLSGVVSQSKEAGAMIAQKYVKFVGACSRQTDNLIPRTIRFDTLYDEAF
jgi:hypothetical protein